MAFRRRRSPGVFRSKYHAIKTVVDGVKCDSKMEARRWLELRLLEKAGAIRFLRFHPRFDLHVNGKLICFYEADAEYEERETLPKSGLVMWRRVVEDTKGMKTPAYRLKAKLMDAVHRIQIREVTA